MSDDEGDHRYCYVCGNREVNAERLIECVVCKRFVHFKCKRIFGFSINTVKAKPYLCSSECKNMQSTGGNEEVLKEIRALTESVQASIKETAYVRGALVQMQEQMKVIADTNKSIEESQNFISKEFEVLKANLEAYKQEVHELKQGNSKVQECVSDLYAKNHELSTRVDQLELELDRVNRARLTKNVVIMGLPTCENENTLALVRTMCGALGFVCGEKDVLQARRLVSKKEAKGHPPILATFNTENDKEKLFEKKRNHGVLLASAVANVFAGSTSRVTIRDEMTAFGRQLLQEVKEMQSFLNLKYVWPGRDGKVLIRRQEGSKVEQVSCKSQLQLLSKTTNKRAADGSPLSSSFQEPSSKKTNCN